ncbi:uncharacterized protein MYCFIDRAFT_81952 [Pseudocercospora fijiensis CIRAD86]|uniref:RING-type domain-containing protein n=1 Tax=Pseudocercospora fijiensis (strain CIRAD86) TaxID=383855 RepID=M2Z894_PSEFD|nr:uncharacterized protein MYCFIDRAFT_81952 [Pseudocercospora fijiensis CIRAD86]EME85995.1 hypothetical protein MYCFIDRAFT_81952 [Pseudocercospora fijiensis CIRAD86]
MASHATPAFLTALPSPWPRLLVISAVFALSTAFTAYIATDREETATQLPDADALLTSLKAPTHPEPNVECIICRDDPEDPVQIACNHVFCRVCLASWLLGRKNESCPYCFHKICTSTGHTSTACNVLLCCWLTTGLLIVWAATHYLALALSKYGLALAFKIRFVAAMLVLYAIAMALLDLTHHAVDQRRDLGVHWWKGVSRGDNLDSLMAGASVMLAGLSAWDSNVASDELLDWVKASASGHYLEARFAGAVRVECRAVALCIIRLTLAVIDRRFAPNNRYHERLSQGILATTARAKDARPIYGRARRAALMPGVRIKAVCMMEEWLFGRAVTTFLIGSSFAVLDALIAWFVIPDVSTRLEDEDEAWKQYLARNGWEAKFGDTTSKDPTAVKMDAIKS